MTTVGLSRVVTGFMAVQTWHCTLENADTDSLGDDTWPGSGGASGGRGVGTAFKPKRSSSELASVPTGLVLEGNAGGGAPGEGVNGKNGSSGIGSIPVRMAGDGISGDDGGGTGGDGAISGMVPAVGGCGLDIDSIPIMG